MKATFITLALVKSFDFVPKIVFYTPSDVSFHIKSTNYEFAYLTGFIWVSGTSKSIGRQYQESSSSSASPVYNYFNLVEKTLYFYGEVVGRYNASTRVNEAN